MPIIAAQMEIKMLSNVTADSVVNTFHFVNTSTATAVTDIETGLFSFYDDIVGIFPGDVAQNGHVLKCYDLSQPKPRAPVLEETYNFPSGPTTAPLPHQVSVCMSFQGDRVSGVPQARRRGRVFLGPLRSSLVSTSGRPSSTLVSDVVNAGDALLTFMQSTTTDWVVYSPTDNDSVTITNGWCDDRFDIQRRRARDATARTVFP